MRDVEHRPPSPPYVPYLSPLDTYWARLRDVQHGDLRLGHVLGGHSVRLLPLVAARVHLHHVLVRVKG